MLWWRRTLSVMVVPGRSCRYLPQCPGQRQILSNHCYQEDCDNLTLVSPSTGETYQQSKRWLVCGNQYQSSHWGRGTCFPEGLPYWIWGTWVLRRATYMYLRSTWCEGITGPAGNIMAWEKMVRRKRGLAKGSILSNHLRNKWGWLKQKAWSA